MRRPLLAVVLAAALLLPTLGSAKTFKWTSQGDILTLDPHSQNEGLNIVANLWVYDGLLRYNEKFELTPALATAWEQVTPTLWRFKLREGVKFHDGSAFTADDVVFSINRALAPSSQFKSYAAGITKVSDINDKSNTAKSTASGTSPGCKCLKLNCSRATTRASLRNFHTNWFVPTSNAYTRRAPCCSKQSVNPPVEAPASRQTIPSG